MKPILNITVFIILLLIGITNNNCNPNAQDPCYPPDTTNIYVPLSYSERLKFHVYNLKDTVKLTHDSIVENFVLNEVDTDTQFM